MNLNDVQQQMKTSEENKVLYATGQRRTYPDGIYIFQAILDENGQPVINEINTGIVTERNGEQYYIHIFTLVGAVHNVDTGAEFKDLEITLSNDMIRILESDCNISLVVQTQWRARRGNPPGQKDYQVFKLVDSFETEEERERFVTSFLESD